MSPAGLPFPTPPPAPHACILIEVTPVGTVNEPDVTEPTGALSGAVDVVGSVIDANSGKPEASKPAEVPTGAV